MAKFPDDREGAQVAMPLPNGLRLGSRPPSSFWDNHQHGVPAHLVEDVKQIPVTHVVGCGRDGPRKVVDGWCLRGGNQIGRQLVHIEAVDARDADAVDQRPFLGRHIALAVGGALAGVLVGGEANRLGSMVAKSVRAGRSCAVANPWKSHDSSNRGKGISRLGGRMKGGDDDDLAATMATPGSRSGKGAKAGPTSPAVRCQSRPWGSRGVTLAGPPSACTVGVQKSGSPLSQKSD